MTLPGLDPLIHAPVRLQICAILSAADEEFADLEQRTGEWSEIVKIYSEEEE